MARRWCQGCIYPAKARSPTYRVCKSPKARLTLGVGQARPRSAKNARNCGSMPCVQRTPLDFKTCLVRKALRAHNSGRLGPVAPVASAGAWECLGNLARERLEREKRDKAELAKKRATLEALARTNKIQIEEIEKANADLASLVKVSE